MVKKSKKQIPLPIPQEGDDKFPGIITYNAWISAIRDNCSCQACQFLKKLTPYIARPLPLSEDEEIRLKEE